MGRSGTLMVEGPILYVLIGSFGMRTSKWQWEARSYYSPTDIFRGSQASLGSRRSMKDVAAPLRTAC